MHTLFRHLSKIDDDARSSADTYGADARSAAEEDVRCGLDTPPARVAVRHAAQIPIARWHHRSALCYTWLLGSRVRPYWFATRGIHSGAEIRVQVPAASWPVAQVARAPLFFCPMLLDSTRVTCLWLRDRRSRSVRSVLARGVCVVASLLTSCKP